MKVKEQDANHTFNCFTNLSFTKIRIKEQFETNKKKVQILNKSLNGLVLCFYFQLLNEWSILYKILF